MIIEIHVQATSHHVHVRVPQARLTDKVPGVIAYYEEPRSRARTVVAIGKTADDLQREVPERWERDKASISFVHPFDVASFDPVLICAVLDYYTQRAYARLRPGLLVRWLGKSFDRFDYDLQIKGYDQLPADKRTEFERLLKRYLPRIHALSINGQLGVQVARQRRGPGLSLAVLVAFWWLVLGAGALLILSRAIGGAAPEQPNLLLLLLMGGVILSVSYVSALLGGVTWIAVMSRFMNKSTIVTFLPSLRLPASIKKWAVKTFLGETKDDA